MSAVPVRNSSSSSEILRMLESGRNCSTVPRSMSRSGQRGKRRFGSKLTIAPASRAAAMAARWA